MIRFHDVLLIQINLEWLKYSKSCRLGQEKRRKEKLIPVALKLFRESL